METERSWSQTIHGFIRQLACSERNNPSRESACKAPRSKEPYQREQPKGEAETTHPLQRVIRWGPWHYRFWREIARWCYEQSLHNPAVVPADDGFPAHRQLLESYQQIRQETLEVARSGRLPANHDIMQQQRTLYEFDRKIWGMLPLRGYGYNYPANQR